METPAARHIRLAEVMGAVSLATDLARGQALESAMGTTIVATRLARAMKCDPELLSPVFYTAISRTLGCTSMAMEVAPLVLGEDRSFGYAMHLCDLADPVSVQRELNEHFARHRSEGERQQAIRRVLDHHGQLPAMAAATGHQVVALTRRLPLPSCVSEWLEQVDARWDGKNPLRAAANDIPVAMRIVELCVVAELFRRAGGIAAAVEVVMSRVGTQFDPSLCSVFRDQAAKLFDGFDAPSLWPAFLDAEPQPHRTIDAEGLRVVAEVAADYADNKSGWFVGHSRLVAGLARAAAIERGLDETVHDTALMAGLFHDLGRCGVPNGIWDKPGPLLAQERRVAETHSLHSEQILSTCSGLRQLASIAGAAHERMDGSGYHHRRIGHDLVADLIAASDVYVALIHDRPWREAVAPDQAAEQLLAEAAGGRMSYPAVRAILGCAGHAGLAARATPDGLTPREVEVLVLVARGLATKQIADKLGIAFKTADNHLQNLYRKIGASSRAAAAMYAVEQGIYSP